MVVDLTSAEADMVMGGGSRTNRTALELEHARQDRNAWLFAVAMVLGCALPVGAAIMFTPGATARPVVGMPEVAGTPASHAGHQPGH